MYHNQRRRPSVYETVPDSLLTTLADPWIGENFYDITYTLWITGATPYIQQAEIVAWTKAGSAEARRKIQMKLWDFNKEIDLEAPLP